MKNSSVRLFVLSITVGCMGVGVVAARAQAPAECSQEELTAKVPELDALHEVIYQLWHEAYPAKDTAMIKQLLPQADKLTAKLDAAILPGILRDQQAAWDEGKGTLKNSLAALHKAADANDEAAMLKATEAYHAAFEGLVRTVRPVTPEMDAFHQELYKLYHYYAPEYDLPNIRAASLAMKERVPALKASTLPAKLAPRQKDYDAAVVTLATAVDDLAAKSEKDDRDAVLAAVEKVHSAYAQTLGIFE